MTLVIKNSESGWLICKVRKSTRTLLRIAPLKTQAEAKLLKLFAVFGMLLCKEVTRIRYDVLPPKKRTRSLSVF